MKNSSYFALFVALGVVFFIVSNWETFFTDFHNLFFARGSWVFEYSDTLIRLFPIRFWQDAALTVGGLIAVEALLILVGCWWWMRRQSE